MKFIPLHSSLGAVVENFNCNNAAEHDANLLVSALEQWQVLLFRNQTLTDGSFAQFCRNFGKLEILPEPEKRHPEYPEIFNLTNVKSDGSLTHREEPQAVFLRGAGRWHTDSSFRENPSLATMLYALTVPPIGGDTEFANMISAFESLSTKEKTVFKRLNAIHSYKYSRSTNPGKLNPISAKELAKVPEVIHPLVRSLPDGRESIYIGTHASHIFDRDVDESRQWLRDLEERMTNLNNVYRHRWRKGDLLIWDNRSTLHRLREYDIDKYPRVMKRCTVAGHGKVLPTTS
ncbi:MAG: hypothetical protein CMM58_11375 [Rhodospirillaceae bacterium]|nr:hypothetical protein [Rhodospirillaceae bacterium]